MVCSEVAYVLTVAESRILPGCLRELMCSIMLVIASGLYLSSVAGIEVKEGVDVLDGRPVDLLFVGARIVLLYTRAGAGAEERLKIKK